MYTLQSCRESAFLCIMLNVGHSQPSPWGATTITGFIYMWRCGMRMRLLPFVLTMRLPTTHFAPFQSYRRLKGRRRCPRWLCLLHSL